MGFWKILGGVAIGVGAVAAAPFTGGGSLLAAGVSLGSSLAGAGAVAAAVAAGSAGAVAGAALSKQEDEQRKREIDRTKKEATAAGEKLAEDKWAEKFAQLKVKMKETHEYENTLIGLMAVGLAVANADGVICDEEVAELDAFVSGISASSLPSHIKDAIQKMRQTPPDINQAISIARVSNCTVDLIDFVIEVMAKADGVVVPEEEALIAKWQFEMRPLILN